MFLINGNPADTLAVTDRGFHYGDGVFETIAVNNQKPLCWQAHYQRLLSGCEKLRIQPPTEDLLLQELASLVKSADPAVVKIIVTRGQGGRGYRPPQSPAETTRIIGLYPWPDYPVQNTTEGIHARYCDTRCGINPDLAGIKHLNRLEQVLARSEWQDDDIAEGIMCDTNDCVISGTMSNLFIIKRGKLFTPGLKQCGVDGIIRQAIIDLAGKLSLEAEITHIKKADLEHADALFFTNSIFGLWPVKQLADKHYSDSTVTNAIRQALINGNIIVA